jgi:hypothetical protein
MKIPEDTRSIIKMVKEDHAPEGVKFRTKCGIGFKGDHYICFTVIDPGTATQENIMGYFRFIDNLAKNHSILVQREINLPTWDKEEN